MERRMEKGIETKELPIKILLLSVAVLFFSLLLILVILSFTIDYTVVSNESMAYRYFFIERIKFGYEAYVPVGLLDSLIHRFSYSLTGLLHVKTLPEKINLFGLITNMGVIILELFLAFYVLITKTIETKIKVLLLLLYLSILTVSGNESIHRALSADYYSLNLYILMLFATCFAADYNKNDISIRGFFLRCFFIGLAVSNKITMLLPALILFVYANSRVHKPILIKLITAFCGSALAILLVHLITYNFNIAIAWRAFNVLFGYAKNPGGTDFDSVPYQIFFENNLHILLALIFSSLIILSYFYYKNCKTIDIFKTNFFFVVVVVLGIYCIYKRPATTTIVEVSSIFMAIIFYLIIILVKTLKGSMYKFVILPCLIITGICVIRPNYESIFQSYSASHEWSKQHQDFYRLSERIAKKYGKLYVVLDDNRWHHEGIHELLLKGASEFPAWNVRQAGKWILQKEFGEIEFRTHQSTMPNYFDKIPANAPILVFHFKDVDVYEHPLVVNHYTKENSCLIRVELLPSQVIGSILYKRQSKCA